MKNFEKILDQIRKRIIDFVEYLLDLFIRGEKRRKKSADLPAKKNRESKNKVDIRPDYKEIKMGPQEFLVECVSCKTVHELSAICVSCGKPVCTDTTYCRKTQYNEQLDDQVVYCSSCIPV